MAQAPENTICLINFEKGIYDITGQSTVTYSGTSKSSNQIKFDSYSGYFDQNSNTHLDITLPSEAKTISFWFYCTAANATENYPTIFSSNAHGDAGGTYCHIDDGWYSTYPVYRVNASGSNTNNGVYGSTVITRNVWHHFLYSVSGSSHYFFLDGVLQKTVTQSNPNTLNNIYIGALRTASTFMSGCYFTGYIDEILICSECLYTSDFTVPTEAYTYANEVDAPEEPISYTSSTTYGTYYGSIANLTDGDTSTYWWSNAAQSSGNLVMFQFNKPIIFHGLTAVTLNNTGDRISSGTVLQTSVDGTTWNTVGNFTGEASCTFENLEISDIYYVRIYVETSSNKWLCVNEITLDYEAYYPLKIKQSGAWVGVSKVYVKTNGAWVLQTSYEDLFNTDRKYIKRN